jgi:hypothetical protein
MTSTVTNYSNQINKNFPVPGEDNDSQGFRNNFSNIQSALATASAEITNLQIGSVSLSGTNDFGDNVIKRATFQDCSQVTNDLGTLTPGAISVDYTQGGYQYGVANASSTNYTFTVINWPPSGKLGTIRIGVITTSSGAVKVAFGGGVSVLSTTTTLPVTYTQTTPIVWELFSADGGASILARQL